MQPQLAFARRKKRDTSVLHNFYFVTFWGGQWCFIIQWWFIIEYFLVINHLVCRYNTWSRCRFCFGLLVLILRTKKRSIAYECVLVINCSISRHMIFMCITTTQFIYNSGQKLYFIAVQEGYYWGVL
jgi:hypothetical protein